MDPVNSTWIESTRLNFTADTTGRRPRLFRCGVVPGAGRRWQLRSGPLGPDKRV